MFRGSDWQGFVTKEIWGMGPWTCFLPTCSPLVTSSRPMVLSIIAVLCLKLHIDIFFFPNSRIKYSSAPSPSQFGFLVNISNLKSPGPNTLFFSHFKLASRIFPISVNVNLIFSMVQNQNFGIVLDSNAFTPHTQSNSKWCWSTFKIHSGPLPSGHLHGGQPALNHFHLSPSSLCKPLDLPLLGLCLPYNRFSEQWQGLSV